MRPLVHEGGALRLPDQVKPIALNHFRTLAFLPQVAAQVHDEWPGTVSTPVPSESSTLSKRTRKPAEVEDIMKQMHIQTAITTAALLLIVVHLLWPQLSVDVVTVTLLVVAVVPWLGSLFKSLELPGGVKIEYAELQRTKAKAEDAGLLPSASYAPHEAFSLQRPATQDPNLALAGLSIEIEKRLREIADSHDLQIKQTGVSALVRALTDRNLLSRQESTVLSDMLSLLNSAVHGAEVGAYAVDWAMDVGPRLLQSLDERIAA